MFTLKFPLQTIASIAFLTSSLTLFQNCSEVSFGNSDLDFSILSQLSEDSQSEQFLVEKKGLPIDMVWVIDNSGSMSAEANHVRSNFSNFIDYLGQSSDIKVALISKTAEASSRGVTLPLSSSVDGLQIERNVASRDSLDILLNELSKNQLGSFLRNDSRKVFVVVTDDNSHTSANSFDSSLNNIMGDIDYNLYGFLGVSSGDGCTARVGSVYMELASLTESDFYDICQPDWQQHFSDLTKEITSLKSEFVLSSSGVERVDLITVNSQIITEDSYTLSGNKVAIDPAVFENSDASQFDVRIYYSPL